jgi:hypothetical protein
MELNKVVRVYSGSLGCMCGCKGKYSDSDRSRKIIFNKIMRNPNHKFDAAGTYVYVETETRNLVAYFA